jgi:DNA-binding NarL/FixJ family response regulator
VKIVIVEDHGILRHLLCSACEHDYGHKVVGEAGDGLEAVEVVARTCPDALLLDLQLPECDGFGVIAQVRRSPQCQTRVIVLSGFCDDFTVYRLEQARVHGFVDKRANADDSLRRALEAIAAGRTYFSESFQAIKAARRRDPCSFDKVLSEREQMVLRLFGDLLTDAEVADRLNVSEPTAEKHRFNIQRKLGLRNKADLIRYARDHGFADSTVCQPEDLGRGGGIFRQ